MLPLPVGRPQGGRVLETSILSIRINQRVGLATLAVFFAALAALGVSASAQAGDDDIFVVDEVLLTQGVSTFAASGDGSIVVALQRRSRTYDAILFNRTTNQRQTLANDARTAAITADGSLIAVLTEEKVLVFNATGAVVGSIATVDEGWSTAIAGSANQVAIVYPGEIVIHDLADGAVVFRWPYSWTSSSCCWYGVRDISLSDDGKRLLVTRVSTQRNSPTWYQNIVIDVESGTEFEFGDEATSPGAISADGSTVAWVREDADGGRLEAIDLATGESQVLQRTIAFDQWTYHPARNRVALSASGDVVAFATTTALSPFDQAVQVPAVADVEPTSSQDAYIWDRVTGSVTLASVPADGNTARRQVIGELHLVDDASQLVLGRHGRLEVAVPVALASLMCGDLPVTVNLLLGDTPTNGDDVIFGTPIDDQIDAGLGHDAVCTGSGNDIIRGGEVVDSGNGNDVIRGTSARDILFGGGGRDRIFGGKGRDLLRGGGGADVISGGPGVDRCVRLDSADTVRRCEILR